MELSSAGMSSILRSRVVFGIRKLLLCRSSEFSTRDVVRLFVDLNMLSKLFPVYSVDKAIDSENSTSKTWC